MNSNDFSNAMNMIGDSYISEAVSYQKSRPRRWIKWCAAVACLCLISTGAAVLTRPEARQGGGITVTEDGVAIPAPEISLAADQAADMVAFFIYQGRVYTQYEWVNGVDLAGEPLGFATGLIDEWTPADGYVELSGSVSGDFYAVNGFDPSFMLCMVDGDQVSTYICNSGITLKYGRELYQDRLHLLENYVSAEYESRDSWYNSRGEIRPIDRAQQALNDIIISLNDAEFVPTASVPLEGGCSSIYETELYHLYFRMQNGMTVALRLFEGGYVAFQGILDICVQLPQAQFSALIDLLEG